MDVKPLPIDTSWADGDIPTIPFGLIDTICAVIGCEPNLLRTYAEQIGMEIIEKALINNNEVFVEHFNSQEILKILTHKRI